MTTPQAQIQIQQSIRPWLDDFLSLSLPTSFPEVSLRIQKNLYAFRSNYLLISLLIFLLTLIPHPVTFILFLIIVTSWNYLLFSRDQHPPFLLFDFQIPQRFILILLSVVTLGALALTLTLTSVWWNLFLAVFISAIVVSLHALFRTPDDDIEESPYGALLSVIDDEDDTGRGPYTLV